jgi:starch-binding outer membrane protein, SusD/RagB family
MININFSELKPINFLLVLSVLFLLHSCSELDDRDFADEEYLTLSHAQKLTELGSTQGLAALDGAILAYFRDGGSSYDEFGLKAVDMAMDLKSNDMDMTDDSWFGDYSLFDNHVLTSGDNEFLWEFFYKIINQANGIINSIDPTVSPVETLNYYYQSHSYRGIAYFYLLRLYQHTRAADGADAVPIDFGDFVGNQNSTVAQVKKQITDDLEAAYLGLKDYDRGSSKELVDASVVAAYLSRYYLTYENWEKAIEYADVAIAAGTISSEVDHGYDSLSLSEVIWGSEVTATTSETYASFFAHMSHIQDGYTGWSHDKTINSLLYEAIPSTDKRKAWFAERDYEAGEIIVPGTWDMYLGISKYAGMKFFAFDDDGSNGLGKFVGDYIYLRNTEFILTKAEALAQQSKFSDAADELYDLNSVRDPSYVLSTKTGQDLIDEILLYRRIEMWGEGLGMLDMARLGIGLNRKDGRVNGMIPGGNNLVIPALDDKFIYAIPLSELDAKPKPNQGQ